MSALEDLIQEIADEDLRRRIEKEIVTLKGTKKFGLVFEPQNPECTPLYDVPVRKKSLVTLNAGKLEDLYRVTKIVGDEVSCVRVSDGEEMTLNKDNLISVAQFGDAIYPYLQPLDTVCNAPDSSLWHTLIEADNYHALQLLKYLYGGKVDCIYIDPPYNTGARDWKYNNDYVDASNEYRHSKWLSMMERRLKLAKDLLNPRDSVLIVTIDEHEYLHLGCLLEEIFRGARIQMISSVINPSGVSRGNEFYRTDEYLFFVKLGNAAPGQLTLDDEWITARSTGKDKDILEPHDPNQRDNVGKAKGFANYAKENQISGRLQLIREKKILGQKVFIRLDMSKAEICDRVCRANTNGELDSIFDSLGQAFGQ